MLLNEDFKNTTNSFILSLYGSSLVLAFKGSKDFIKRSYNLCYNYSITNGNLLHFDGEIYYIIIKKEKNGITPKERLRKGLNLYFINEIKMNKEIPLLKDQWNNDESEYLIEYDEAKIQKMASIRTDEFIIANIKEDNFMMQYFANSNSNIFPIYKNIYYTRKDHKTPIDYEKDKQEELLEK